MGFSLGFILLRGVDSMLLSLRWPLSISLDASILRFESWSWMHGQMPWVDILSLNLPLTHYIHMFGLLVFGSDDLGFRITDVTWIGILAVCTFIALRPYSRVAALTGAILTTTLVCEATPFGAFQREALMIPFWLVILFCSVRLLAPETFAPRIRGLLWAVGACAFTLACWIKPTSIAAGLMLLLPLLRADARDRLRILTINLFVFFVASALVLLPVLISGHLFDATRSWWSLNLTYASWEAKPILPLLSNIFVLSPTRWMLPLNLPVASVGDTGHLTLFHLVTLIAFLFLRRRKQDQQVLLFLLAGLISFLSQRRGFQYHIYPLWHGFNLVIAILVGDCISKLASVPSGAIDQGPNKRSHASILVSILLLALILTSLVGRQSESQRAYRGTGLLNKKASQKPVEFQIVQRVAEKADEMRKGNQDRTLRYQVIEDASIALGAVIPSNLTYASRFPVDYLFFTDSPYRDQFRDQLMQALREKKPEIIVYSANFPGSAKARRIDTFPELKAFLQNYEIEVVTEKHGIQYFLYTRRD